MKNILVVAPHPDDETLACGGTLLRHKADGDKIFWLIVTEMSEKAKYPADLIKRRKSEIESVARVYGFDAVFNLRLATTRLDAIPIGEIIDKISTVFREIMPATIYLPFRDDVHTDHTVVFDAVSSCTKWFRYGSIKRVLAYETISETEFGINPSSNGFRPNVFVNIGDFLERKIATMKLYETEMKPFPFPRSEEVIRALAALRGSAAGCRAAEAFMLLKEIR